MQKQTEEISIGWAYGCTGVLVFLLLLLGSCHKKKAVSFYERQEMLKIERLLQGRIR